MTPSKTSTAAYFEAKYQDQPDPWDFVGSKYEQDRYDAIIAAIGHRRYRSVFEPGCSIGVLTERLASLSDCVTAIDLSPTAVAQASARCAHLPSVNVSCAPLGESVPVHGFDLIVLSEIGYYFSADEWLFLSSRIVETMDEGATLLAAHWLGNSSDHCIDGDTVHEILNVHPRLSVEHSKRHSAFRIDRWACI